MRRFLICVVVSFCLIGCQGETPETGVETPLVYDVGVIERKITTTSPDAQLWFNRGLGLAYGFNHEEAIACFDRAIEADPDCAMCYWGKAYAYGPNYNDTMMTEEKSQAAYEAVQLAVEKIDNASAVEQGLIRALATRYAWPAPEDRSGLELAYADAMRDVWVDYPEDGDVSALTAEAVMLLRPWQLWSHDGVPAPETHQIRAILEGALKINPDHPALCHLYIHTMEAGPEAAKAIPAAEAMEALTPGWVI